MVLIRQGTLFFWTGQLYLKRAASARTKIAKLCHSFIKDGAVRLMVWCYNRYNNCIIIWFLFNLCFIYLTYYLHHCLLCVLAIVELHYSVEYYNYKSWFCCNISVILIELYTLLLLYWVSFYKSLFYSIIMYYLDWKCMVIIMSTNFNFDSVAILFLVDLELCCNNYYFIVLYYYYYFIEYYY